MDLNRLQAAFYTDNGITHASAATSRVVQIAVQALADAGMVVEENRPPEIEQPAAIWDQLLISDGGAKVARLLRTAGTAQMHPSIQWTHAVKAMSIGEYSDLLTRWNLFRSKMLSFMKRYDLIICPVSPSPAVPHGEVRGPEFSYTKAFNLTDWPSTVFRGGTSPEGLPIGVQLVARPWREDVALAAGRYLESIPGGWQRPPEQSKLI